MSDKPNVQNTQLCEIDGINGLNDVMLDSGHYAHNAPNENVFQVKFVVHDFDPASVNNPTYPGPDLTQIQSYENMMNTPIRDVYIDMGAPTPAFVINQNQVNANGIMELRGTIPLIVQLRQMHVTSVDFYSQAGATDNGNWAPLGTDITRDGDIFEFDWDTITGEVTDGVYMIKAVATDVHGRTGECIMIIIVDNTKPSLDAFLNPAFYDASYSVSIKRCGTK